MKKSILTVLIMLVMIATPCLADVETAGPFSIEGTKWLTITVGIFPPIIPDGEAIQYLGFYEGKVYRSAYGEGPYDMRAYDDSSYTNLSGMSSYSYSQSICSMSSCSYYNESGIISTPGIGIAARIGQHGDFVKLWTLLTVILLKVDDKWEPWIHPRELDFGTTETDMTFRLRVAEGNSWTIESSKSWISFSPDSGDEGIYDIDVSVDRTGLYPADYEAILYIFIGVEVEAYAIARMKVTDFPENEVWQIEIVDTFPTVDPYTYIDYQYTSNSLALDSSDKAHISYLELPEDQGYFNYLKYATNSSGEWVIEAVDTFQGHYFYLYEYPSSKYTSITLDSKEKVHIAYVAVSLDSATLTRTFYLNYCTNSSGEWTIETVDNVVDPYTDSISLTLDSNDRAHISYIRRAPVDAEFDDSLYYATNASGFWMTEVLDSFPCCGGTTSIANDSNDKTHIVFSHKERYRHGIYTIISGSMDYITNSSGSWVIEELLGDYLVSGQVPLALDSDDKAHISYAVLGYYIYHVTNISGEWLTEIIDSGSRSNNSSLVLGPNDKVYVGYISGSLIHAATNASGKWVAEPLEAGTNISLVVDSNDKAHISYVNDNELKYAYKK